MKNGIPTFEEFENKEHLNEKAVIPKTGKKYIWNVPGYPPVNVKVLKRKSKNHYQVLALEDEPKGDITKDAKFDAIIDREGEYFEEIKESLNEEQLNEGGDTISPEILALVKSKLPELEKLIAKRSGVKTKLSAELDTRSGNIEISSGSLKKQLSNLGKTVFADINIYFWGGGYNKKHNEVWFNPKVSYSHPNGGSNGADFIWDSLWFVLADNTWKEGRTL